eukprot:CAMPEP_0202889658 /NCGR_PEP_ID=MMETSP1392-20130828/259_1 /ASSEMBLY_ACC=CAM_ASM_000868 /TAXON_ID=225041 /ORGANISM="Chlamydomonas chlamydogama, Strain SAG 11-48b" /LENGTH=169 /DNA_ID=CAMNT_0049573041 /DNA_START=104 /DNA_END=611 /DNA_ORIENTATION=-
MSPKQLEEKEQQLQDWENNIKLKEERLNALGYQGAADNQVTAARWQSLAEERKQLASRWNALCEDKRHLHSLETLVLSAALSRPSDQDMKRDGSADEEKGALLGGAAALGPALGLTGGWPGSQPLQHTWCAIWSVQQIQWVSLAQQQQQADMPWAAAASSAEGQAAAAA